MTHILITLLFLILILILAITIPDVAGDTQIEMNGNSVLLHKTSGISDEIHTPHTQDYVPAIIIFSEQTSDDPEDK